LATLSNSITFGITLKLSLKPNKEKALPVASEIIHEANNKLRALFTDPKYKGEDVVWAGLVLDTLPTTTVKNEGEVLQ
jgi:hypothetical protein